MIYWEIISSVCVWQFICYLWMKVFARTNDRARAFCHETWWVTFHIAGPIALVEWWSDGFGWTTIFDVANTIIWILMYWDDHDDRWKKRRKKSLSKVKEVAGKLIVIPLPHPT